MIHLALQQLRRRGLRYASLFFAVFASVALTVAATALTLSVVNNVNELFTKPYAQADVVIPVTADDELVVDQIRGQVAAVPGVEAVTYQQNSVVFIRLPGGIYEDAVVQTIEPGPLQWREVTEGRLPEAAHEIVVTDSDEAPEVGSEVSLRVSSDRDDQVFTVVGHVESAAQEVMSGTDTLMLTQQSMRDWGQSSHRGEFRVRGDQASIADITQAASVADAATSVSSAQGYADELADSYLGSRDRYFLLLFAFVLVAAAVAFLVVFSAYSVLAGERTREFGLIRSLGASTPQILGSVVVESLILGLVASGLGTPAGLFMARLLAQEAPRFGVRFPIDNVDAPSQLLWLILGAGVVMPVLAALPATVSVVRQPTVAALTSSAVMRSHPASVILWWLLTLGLGVGSWWLFRQLPQLTGDLVLLATLAASGSAILVVLLVLALLLASVIQSFSRLLGSLPVPSLQLGMAFAGRQKIRAAALVAVIIAGAALTSAVLHGQTQIREHLMTTATGMGGSDLRVTSLDDDVSPALLDEIAHLEGVSGVVAPGTTTVDFLDAGTVTAMVLDDATGETVLRGKDSGALPGTVVLGQSSGLQDLLKPGAEVAAEINDEPVQVKILHGNDYATMVHPGLVQQARDVKATELGVSSDYLPEQPVRSMLVLLDGPAHQDAEGPGVAAVQETIASYPGRYSISEGFTTRSNTVNLVERVSTMSTLLSLVALIIAAVGLINTVALTVAERARDRVLLRAIGLTRPGQVLVMVTEMISLALPSAVIGAAVGGHFGTYIAQVATGHRGVPISDVSSLDLRLVMLITAAMTLGGVLCGLVVLSRKI